MFITVKFSPADARPYTYAWDHPAPPAVGDTVMVENKDGLKPVTVVLVDVPEPSFLCKAAHPAPKRDDDEIPELDFDNDLGEVDF